MSSEATLFQPPVSRSHSPARGVKGGGRIEPADQQPHVASKRFVGGVLTLLLICHASLLAWAAYRDSPTWDEVGHFAAGVSYWSSGRFSLYRVNPPLLRLVASAPVIFFCEPKIDFGGFDRLHVPWMRPEFDAGRKFAEANSDRYFWFITVSRWAMIPFSLLGAYVCFIWARQLFGAAAGLMAATLWAFCPNIIGHGHLITPDLGATALGLAASYLFWRWLHEPIFPRAIVAGLVLGAAQLTKTTWIVLFGLWPLLWFIHRMTSGSIPKLRLRTGAVHIAVMYALALIVLNAGYGFEGTFKRLSDFHFVSATFSGNKHLERSNVVVRNNRFVNSWLGALPVPLPESYLSGIDVQKKDFEMRMPSYLRGEWRNRGWWHYYLYAMLIKVPIGTLLLVGAAIAVTVVCRRYNTGASAELVLLIPALSILALISSQTGFNHHLRYVLPLFPFIFIWLSKVARSFEFGHRSFATMVVFALLASILSSLSVYPHSLSYFNELIGGPKNGHRHLANSNVDWGQDLLYLKRWLDRHPEAKPLHLVYDLPLVDPRMAGIEHKKPPIDPRARRASEYQPHQLGPSPGWFAISANELNGVEHTFDYFQLFKPVDWIGYSMCVYHIELGEANSVRRKLGLPELPGSGARPEP